jgi:membrane fusion protein (multidrug efflux system)
MKPPLKHSLHALALLLPLLLLPACGPKSEAPPAGGGFGMMGPLEVGVLTVAASPVTLTQDLPGRISAYRVAEVRARVDGIVLRRLFKEGTDVEEGQVLYEIDPAPYQAALDSAEGTLARAKATLARAEAGLAAAELKEERYKSLLETKAISKQE